MNTIKFSHPYAKLWGQNTARLIWVEVFEPGEELGEMSIHDLLEYDTKIAPGEYYELPAGDLIQLVFIGSKRIPFCTLRRYTKEKYEYYKSKIDQDFIVEVREVR